MTLREHLATELEHCGNTVSTRANGCWQGRSRPAFSWRTAAKC
jgi:hypothetical protein